VEFLGITRVWLWLFNRSNQRGFESSFSSLIEYYAGNFPLWLAPDQVRVITLNDDEALINYAKPIVAELCANRVRVDAD
jgi:threonyl-tRNA synthetase